MKSYFFNAEATGDLVAHPTGYDREYDADDQAAFFAPFFSDSGVFAGTDADACKVTVQEGTTLGIAAGAVYARGRMALFDGTETITVENACIVAARMNKTSDVRAFQLVAVTEPVRTEDVYDVELAAVTLEAVVGGYEVQVTDKRTFVAFTGQPPYYPPTSDDLPYVLWLYVLGLPLTAEQRAAVEGNPSLMGIFNASLGAARKSTVPFAEDAWTGAAGAKTIVIRRQEHNRQSGEFGFSLWHLVDGAYRRNTWATLQTDIRYDEATGSITLDSPDTYPGKIVFFG